MKIDIAGVIEGTVNSIFVKEEIEKVKAERLAICATCPENSKNVINKPLLMRMRPDDHCTLCGCNLVKKARCLSCECPAQKWKQELSDEEETKLIEKIPPENEDS